MWEDDLRARVCESKKQKSARLSAGAIWVEIVLLLQMKRVKQSSWVGLGRQSHYLTLSEMINEIK